MNPPDINFDCPECGQNLEAPGDMKGLFIECPGCSRIIRVPMASGSGTLRPAAPMPPASEADEQKSSTMRLNLPPGGAMPEPRHRRIIIKRSDH